MNEPEEKDQPDEDYFPSVSIDRLMQTPAIQECLDQSKFIEAATPTAFADQIRKYIDSRGGEEEDDDDTGRIQEYWPLIKKVRISLRAPVLSAGAILVDLPGAGDSSKL